MDQWVAPDHLCFKVRVAHHTYLLKYHLAQDAWEAELVTPGAVPPDNGEN
jgi:hypothetical protein